MDVPAATIFAYLMLYVLSMIPMTMLLNTFWSWVQNWLQERRRRFCDATALSNAAVRAGSGDVAPLFAEAGANRCSAALNNLAVLLECGHSVQRDVPRAMELYRRAIELDGNEAATYNLMLLLKCSEASYADTALADECFERLSSEDRAFADAASPSLGRLITRVREQQPFESEAAIEPCEWDVRVENVNDCLTYVKTSPTSARHAQSIFDE